MGNLSINFQSKPTNYVGKRHGDMISDRQKDETTCKGKMTIIKPQPAPNHPASTSLSMPGNWNNLRNYDWKSILIYATLIIMVQCINAEKFYKNVKMEV